MSHLRSEKSLSPIGKYDTGQSSPGNGSAAGTCRVPLMMPALSCELLNICASQLDLLMPTSTKNELVVGIHMGKEID